tara:strand:- start:150 stop:830 length:681 start_codon:yes stop_codon:yes gene_type:complete
MAFPPEFSSTESYANRYDLDEIDVFLEGDSSNPMFFNVTGLKQNYSFGKHYFNISILDTTKQRYDIKPNSRILFEVKSINNVVIRSNIVKLNQKSGVANCFLEILKDPLRTFKEVEDGQGTITVVTSLINKKNTLKIIPDRFLGAMNYRCVFPINIAKNLINADSPSTLNVEHTLTTQDGEFSFVKRNIPSLKSSTLGSKFNTTTGKPTTKRRPSGTTRSIKRVTS